MTSAAEKPPSQEPKDEDYKTKYLILENRLGSAEQETLICLDQLFECLALLKAGCLGTVEHTTFFLETALPRIVKELLKHRYIREDVNTRIQQFIRAVLVDVIIKFIPNNTLGVCQALVHIFDEDAANFYITRGMLDPVPENELFAVIPQRFGSFYLVNFINTFGRHGGFDVVLQQLKRTEPRCPPNMVGPLLEAIYKAQHHKYLVEPRARDIVNQLRDIIETYLLQLTDSEFKAIRKEELETIIKHFSRLLDTVLAPSQAGEIVEKLCLELALRCLRSEYFDKRLYGVQYLNDMVEMTRRAEDALETAYAGVGTGYGAATSAASYGIGSGSYGVVSALGSSPYSSMAVSGTGLSTSPTTRTFIGPQAASSRWVTTSYLVKWIQKHEIMNLLFGKDRYHDQILKRSGAILRFMAKNDALQPGHIELMWQSAMVHDSLALTVFKVLGENCYYLQPQHIEQIIELLAAIPREEWTATTVALVNDIARNCREFDHKHRMVQQLWKLVADDHSQLEISLAALRHFQEIIKTVHAVKIYRDRWLNKLIDAICKGRSVAFCYQLMETIISTYPAKPSAIEHDNEASIIERLEEQNGLLDLFFEDMSHFKQAANKARAAVRPSTDLNAAVLAGRLEYLQEIKVRLNFLTFLLSRHKRGLPRDRYAGLWDLLVQSAFTEAERAEFFGWLLHGSNEGVIDPTAAVALFTERLVNWSPAEMSPLAFQCFVRLFVSTNVVQNRMVMLRPSPADAAKEAAGASTSAVAPTGAAAAMGSATSAAQLKFEVLDYNLFGHYQLIDIIGDATHPEVVREAIDFLIKLYSHPAQEYLRLHCAGSRGKVHEDLLNKCMSFLSTFVMNRNALLAGQKTTLSLPGTVADFERRIERILSVIMTFLKQCEADVMYKRSKHHVMSHGARTRGRPLTLNVTNTIPNAQPPENFELEVYSNETVGQLRKKIKAMLPATFTGAAETLQLTLASQKTDLKEDNKTLDELNFENNQEIVVSIPVGPSGQELTYLRSRYDDGPSAAAANAPPTPEVLEKAKQLMEIYNISQAVALIALRKAYNDVQSAAMQLSDENTIAELKAEVDALGAAAERDVDTTVDGGEPSPSAEGTDEMPPALLLSANQEYFGQLFELLTIPLPSISNLVWELLMQMPTSQAILDLVHTLPPVDGADSAGTAAWGLLFPRDSIYRLLYSLQIVDSLLFIVDERADIGKRIKWCQEFLHRGGFQHLLKIITDTTVGTSSCPATTVQEKLCLALTFKIFDFFLRVLLANSTSSHSAIVAATAGHAGPSPSSPPPSSALEVAPVAKVEGLIKHLTVDAPAKLLESIDFPVLINKLIDIIWAAASKTAPDRYDGEVVAYAMRSMVLCVLSNPSKHWECIFRFGKLTDFLRYIIFQCPEFSIRVEAAEFIYQLCSKVRVQTSGTAGDTTVPLPHQYFLQFLLSNIPDAATTDRAVWSICGQYFHLLERLLEDALKRDEATVDTYMPLLLDFVGKIKKRPIVESRQAPDAVDTILEGMMNVVAILVRHAPHLRTEVGDNLGLVHHLYYHCLFAMKAEEPAAAAPTGTALSVSAKGLGPLAQQQPPPKCKTKPSRIAAFHLLAELCRNNATNFMAVLELLSPHHGAGLKIGSWDYHPLSEARQHAYVGLVNLGCTCYMNSLLQQLYMMPPLRYGLLAVEDTKAVSPESKRDSLLWQLQNVFGYLQESERMAYDPSGFAFAFKDWEGNPTNVHQQQDVNEFFAMLYARLEERLKGSFQEKLLPSLFGGTLVNEISSVDKAYPFVGEREEEFCILSLDIKNRPTLADAFDLFVQSDRLEGENAYYCEKYNRKIDATKRCFIKRLPNALIIHLKRFEYDFSTYRRMKVNDYFEFPLTLNMRPWTREGLMERERKKAAARGDAGPPADQSAGEAAAEEAHPEEYYNYNLTGILIHSGNAEGGHYYSYIKERVPSDGVEPRWFEFNDKVISAWNLKNIEADCYGGTKVVTYWDKWQGKFVKRTYPRAHNAYMLFYERQTFLPTADPAAAATTAQSALTPRTPAEFSSPEFVANLKTIATRRESMAENLLHGVPEQIYRAVWRENVEFIRDSLFFDPIYFDFMREVCGKLFEFPPVRDYNATADDAAAKLIKLGTHFVFETLAHAKETSTLPNWVAQLSSLYERHIPACRWFFQYCIDANMVREMLLECANELIRIQIERLMANVMRVLAPYERQFYAETVRVPKPKPPPGSDKNAGAAGIATVPTAAEAAAALAAASPAQKAGEDTIVVAKSMVIRFIDYVFAMLEDSRPFWRRFKQYFTLIRDFTALGPHERQYLLNRNIMDIYNDYFMGRPQSGQARRVSVMDRFHLPDLVEYIDTIAIIVKGCYNGAPRERGTPPTSIHPLIEFPDSQRKALYDKTFFSSLLEMDYNTQAAIDILLHSCWEDWNTTQWVLDVILRDLGRLQMEKLEIYMNLLTPLLQMQHSIQPKLISLTLTPFVTTPQSPRGLLALIHEIHHHNPRYAYSLIKFIFHLCETTPAVERFLHKQKKEIAWIENFLEARMTSQQRAAGTGNAVQSVDGDIGVDASDSVLASSAANPTGPAGKAQNKERNWKKDSTQLTLATVKKILSTPDPEAGDGNEPSERERILEQENERLRQENERLRETLRYFQELYASSMAHAHAMDYVEHSGGYNNDDDDDDDDDERMVH